MDWEREGEMQKTEGEGEGKKRMWARVNGRKREMKGVKGVGVILLSEPVALTLTVA